MQVIKYESLIHEFDPYFNYRATAQLASEGFYAFWNFFDTLTWYPLGRIVGGTVYPGLMLTASTMHSLLNRLNLHVNIKDACVFTAPFFSALSTLAGYALVRETRSHRAGLCASAFVALVPSYVSRSVAGSFDNEGIAIFALLFTFFAYTRTLNTASLLWGSVLALSFFYMVMSWGGYSFIVNLIPIHVLSMIVFNRTSTRLYVAYAPFVILGTLLACNIPVVGFNAVLTSEHFGSFLALGAIHVALAVRMLARALPTKLFNRAAAAVVTGAAAVSVPVLLGAVAYVSTSPTFGWSGRSLSLLDPTYASKYIPIIASVSEHQPPTWTSYFMDIHVLAFFAPAGLAYCFFPVTDASFFLLLYGLVAAYFSSVMVRLMLVLSPATCCLGGVALSELFGAVSHAIASAVCKAAGIDNSKHQEGKDSSAGNAKWAAQQQQDTQEKELKSQSSDVKPRLRKKQGGKPKQKQQQQQASNGDADDDSDIALWGSANGLGAQRYEDEGKRALPVDMAILILALLLPLLAFYVLHCVWVSADAYSAPSIVLQAKSGKNEKPYFFDDFREAYAWLRYNTEGEDIVTSWWDYGYQTTAMANRGVLVDNNTWNNTHIATVGRAMASPERKGWKIFRSLDVKYVFVVFGGMIGYSGDDINKFLWMVRIGGGVYPEIQEKDYLSGGSLRIDSSASQTMLNSLVYKFCYYRFADATRDMGQPGFDRVRNSVIGKRDVSLRYFEEAFTSQHWMVRIYRVRTGASLTCWINRLLSQ